MTESLNDKIRRVLADPITVCPYDPDWPRRFALEKAFLRDCFPADLIGRIEHVGSTAVAGLPAKPIVDMLIEVSSLEGARRAIAPLLETAGYDYFWRPTHGDDIGPFYAWFIKRDAGGARTHHLHMVEPDFPQWRWLAFRDALIADPVQARAYADLKRDLAARFPDDRIAYTRGKAVFIERLLEQAGP